MANVWVKRFGRNRRYHLVTVDGRESIEVLCGASGLLKSWVDRAEGPGRNRLCKTCLRRLAEVS